MEYKSIGKIVFENEEYSSEYIRKQINNIKNNILGNIDEEECIAYTYNFRWTRNGKNVLEFLEGFEGNVIQSDGYSGYNAAVNYWNEVHPEHKIKLLNCWVHARRGFADAVMEQGHPASSCR